MPDTLLTKLKRFFDKSVPSEVKHVYNEGQWKEVKARILAMPIAEIEKELLMAKKFIKFKTTDGIKPRKSKQPGTPFDLQAPMDIRLGANSSQEVKLGVSCEQPVVVVRGSQVKLFAPGETLSVAIRNDTYDVTVLGRGEVVAFAFVLDNSNNEVAES